MTKTREDVEALKNDWKNDPVWDLCETEGFEENKEELKAFQEQCEAEWYEERMQREKVIDEEADKLGVRGLYRLLKKHEELLSRHDRAIEFLADGESYKAYRVLKGLED